MDEETIGFERALDGDDAAVVDGDLARQQELRQLGRPVRAMDASPAGRRIWANTQTLLPSGPTARSRTPTTSSATSRASSIGRRTAQVIGTADPFRRYRAFMAVLSKRYANRWQAQISYVYAKATGNVDNTSAAQVATRQFETPNLALVNAEGPASYTPTHEFKVLGSYQIPRIETSVSAYFCEHERTALRPGPAVLQQRPRIPRACRPRIGA